MNPRIAIISQARFCSTRLPGKVLMKIGDRTLLEYHLERLSISGFPIIVATSNTKECDPIVDICREFGVHVYRGSESDVLERYYEAAKSFEVDIIIRVTSDCPLIDGSILKKEVDLYLNTGDRRTLLTMDDETYPVGVGGEVFSVEILNKRIIISCCFKFHNGLPFRIVT